MTEPSIPCLTWSGNPVTWDRWELSPEILCSKVRPKCETCGWSGAGHLARGRVRVPSGTVELTLPAGRRKRGEPRTWATVTRPRQEHDLWTLMAFSCPRCSRVDIATLSPSGGLDGDPIAELLCDGCDRLAAAGATFEEARATLSLLGGWASPDADVDLCPACNPAHGSDVPPRALAAFRRAPDPTQEVLW